MFNRLFVAAVAHFNLFDAILDVNTFLMTLTLKDTFWAEVKVHWLEIINSAR